MAAPQPHPAPQPDFTLVATSLGSVATAATQLQTELPRIANANPIHLGQQTQQLINQNGQLSEKIDRVIRQNRRNRRQIRQIGVQIGEVIRRLSSVEIRLRNIEIRAQNTRISIRPLLGFRTGNEIPGCPTASEEISGLSTARADRILEALEIEVDKAATLPIKRELVRLALLPVS
jgi:hypothetical protein